MVATRTARLGLLGITFMPRRARRNVPVAISAAILTAAHAVVIGVQVVVHVVSTIVVVPVSIVIVHVVVPVTRVRVGAVAARGKGDACVSFVSFSKQTPKHVFFYLDLTERICRVMRKRLNEHRSVSDFSHSLKKVAVACPLYSPSRLVSVLVAVVIGIIVERRVVAAF
jgi:hypothetical protein